MEKQDPKKVDETKNVEATKPAEEVKPIEETVVEETKVEETTETKPAEETKVEKAKKPENKEMKFKSDDDELLLELLGKKPIGKVRTAIIKKIKNDEVLSMAEVEVIVKLIPKSEKKVFVETNGKKADIKPVKAFFKTIEVKNKNGTVRYNNRLSRKQRDEVRLIYNAYFDVNEKPCGTCASKIGVMYNKLRGALKRDEIQSKRNK